MADGGANGAHIETRTSVVETQQRAVTPKKPRKRKKSEPSDGQSSNGAGASGCTATASDDGKEKQRVVWTPKLHGKFVKACNELGIEDAVPMKILERMKATGITRAQIASHLQKYRERLSKQKDEAISESTVIALHHTPPAPSPSVPPSPQSPLETPDMRSQPQLGHVVQPLQKPPNSHSSISNQAVEESLLYQELHLLLHQVTRRELIMEEQSAAMMQQHAAAASQHSSPMPVGVEQAAGAPVQASGENHRLKPHVEPSQAVNMLGGEWSIPEDNMILHEESETRMAHLQAGAEAEKGQGQAAKPSIFEQYWRSNDCPPSWDLFGLPTI